MFNAICFQHRTSMGANFQIGYISYVNEIRERKMLQNQKEVVTTVICLQLKTSPISYFNSGRHDNLVIEEISIMCRNSRECTRN